MMVIVLKNDSLLWDPSSKRFVHPHLVMYTVLFATAFTRINGSFKKNKVLIHVIILCLLSAHQNNHL